MLQFEETRVQNVWITIRKRRDWNRAHMFHLFIHLANIFEAPFCASQCAKAVSSPKLMPLPLSLLSPSSARNGNLYSLKWYGTGYPGRDKNKTEYWHLLPHLAVMTELKCSDSRRNRKGWLRSLIILGGALTKLYCTCSSLSKSLNCVWGHIKYARMSLRNENCINSI